MTARTTVRQACGKPLAKLRLRLAAHAERLPTLILGILSQRDLAERSRAARVGQADVLRHAQDDRKEDLKPGDPWFQTEVVGIAPTRGTRTNGCPPCPTVEFVEMEKTLIRHRPVDRLSWPLPPSHKATTGRRGNVRIVCPFTPGGSQDNIARRLSAKLGELSRPVLRRRQPLRRRRLDRRRQRRQVPPDGYSVLLGNIGSHALVPHLYAKPPYNPFTDLETVAGSARSPTCCAAIPTSRTTRCRS